MKKRYIACLIASAAISLGALAGCTESVGISSINKTSSDGLIDYYTITYTDGSTSQFTVTNGKDGEYIKEVTVEDVYAAYNSQYGGDMTFEEFCAKYMSSGNDGVKAVNSALRSCLRVYTAFNEGYSSTTEAMYCGSAVIYEMTDDYSYILTNYHVIYDNKAYGSNRVATKAFAYMYGCDINYRPVIDTSGKYVISSYDPYCFECDVVGGSIEYDVAVLRARTSDILARNSQATPVTVNQSYVVGEEVYAIGDPDDGGMSVTKGIVSVDSEIIELAIDGKSREYRSIRIDAELTHGNSGGGLFNAKGEMIALNNAGDEDVVGMNYAIPASAATAVADGIIDYNGSTKKMYLGVTVAARNTRYVYDGVLGTGKIKDDITVDSVSVGKPASFMGLKTGDVLTAFKINDTTYELDRQFQLGDLLLCVRQGDNVSFTYTRGGVSAETSVHKVSALDDFISVT